MFSSVVYQGSSIATIDTNRLNKLIRRDGSVIGCRQEKFDIVVERRTLNELLLITDNLEQPLRPTEDRQEYFSKRLR